MNFYQRSLAAVFLFYTGTNAFYISSSVSNKIHRNNMITKRNLSSVPIGPPAEKDPKIQAALADVREAAAEFGPDVAAFADKYLNEKLWDGKTNAIGLLDECLIDWDDEQPGQKCQKFEEALLRLDQLLGVVSKDQY